MFNDLLVYFYFFKLCKFKFSLLLKVCLEFQRIHFRYFKYFFILNTRYKFIKNISQLIRVVRFRLSNSIFFRNKIVIGLQDKRGVVKKNLIFKKLRKKKKNILWVKYTFFFKRILFKSKKYYSFKDKILPWFLSKKLIKLGKFDTIIFKKFKWFFYRKYYTYMSTNVRYCVYRWNILATIFRSYFKPKFILNLFSILKFNYNWSVRQFNSTKSKLPKTVLSFFRAFSLLAYIKLIYVSPILFKKSIYVKVRKKKPYTFKKFFWLLHRSGMFKKRLLCSYTFFKNTSSLYFRKVYWLFLNFLNKKSYNWLYII